MTPDMLSSPGYTCTAEVHVCAHVRVMLAHRLIVIHRFTEKGEAGGAFPVLTLCFWY